MGRRRFDQAFKLEAVRLVWERGVSAAQVARDLDVLRKWVRQFAADPRHAFPGPGADEARAAGDRAALA